MKEWRKGSRTKRSHWILTESFAALALLLVVVLGCSKFGGGGTASNAPKPGDIPMPDKIFPVGVFLDVVNQDKSRKPSEGTILGLSGEVLGDVTMPKEGDDNNKYNTGDLAISGSQTSDPMKMIYSFVTCKFTKADAVSFANLKKDDKITIKGIVSDDAIVITLNPCQLVKAGS